LGHYVSSRRHPSNLKLVVFRLHDARPNITDFCAAPQPDPTHSSGLNLEATMVRLSEVFGFITGILVIAGVLMFAAGTYEPSPDQADTHLVD
jgi:hypothetical protein